MAVRQWAEVVEEDFPEVENVTEEMQRAAFKQRRLVRGSIRLMLGRLRTTQEIEDRRRQAIGKPRF